MDGRVKTRILMIMSTPLSPVESQFHSVEEAEAHDRWFRAKVEEALADPRPTVPHDEAVARVRRTIEKAKKQPA